MLLSLSVTEIDEFLQEIDEDVEGLQSTVYFLQQELKTVRDENQQLKQLNERLNNGDSHDTANGDTHNNGNTDPNTCILLNGTSANEENLVRTKSVSNKQSENEEFTTSTQKVKSELNEIVNGDGNVVDVVGVENTTINGGGGELGTGTPTDTMNVLGDSNGIGKRAFESSDTNVDGINPKRTRRTAAMVAMASIESDKKLNCVA